MHVYALVGPSGTGKSHRAIRLAAELHCQVIIDDGLIIEENRILAGTTAKRSSTRMGAIKTALFQEQEHRDEAVQALSRCAPKGILILGTSEGMVEKIAARLELPAIEKIVYIHDIASSNEIRKARYNRAHHGRHVVPAPALEVTRNWTDALINPVKVFFQKKGSERKTWAEQSVVRPTFTSLGNLSISTPAIVAGITHQVQEVPGVGDVGSISISHGDDGVTVRLPITAVYGQPLHVLGRKVQRLAFDILENMGISVLAVDVTIEKLLVK
ncbi:Asp23/Gls24 family envelope stress response protein [Heliobacterium undosum]|uniref:Asp23/Gls24 family envelope stress response protein n=1 Tax=Heliomicrobium undosum TaxID=121734 RepID=A0A845KZ07_9FIRM|nr:Asp23/Gls24 family envelope stress response protein [Heliomicrobium undosum]MZP28326.1 Asp23/Gls24 family envelope stress response protein [Heliomicrobium undosum]